MSLERTVMMINLVHNHISATRHFCIDIIARSNYFTGVNLFLERRIPHYKRHLQMLTRQLRNQPSSYLK